MNALKIKYSGNSNCPILDKNFTIREILGGIKLLKSGKASAYDIVDNDLIKATASSISPILCDIFNRILTLEYVPILWGTSIIIPLFKSGEVFDPNNYRGISISSCISKLFTLLMNNLLNAFFDTNNTNHFNQLGFRKGFRPADHVFTLKTLIDQTFYNKEDLFVCFVDFKKAYDTVWRNGLYLKLLKNGVSKKFVRILMNMYSSLS